MKKFLFYLYFWLVSLTWGCVMTVIGLVVAIVLLITGHKPYRLGPAIYFKVGKYWGGLELGPFFIVCEYSTESTKLHEFGHGIQNTLWGPLMPFVICIPSAIRYWYRRAVEKYYPDYYYSMLPRYDSVWFEGQATRWGTKLANKYKLLK